MATRKTKLVATGADCATNARGLLLVVVANGPTAYVIGWFVERRIAASAATADNASIIFPWILSADATSADATDLARLTDRWIVPVGAVVAWAIFSVSHVNNAKTELEAIAVLVVWSVRVAKTEAVANASCVLSDMVAKQEATRDAVVALTSSIIRTKEPSVWAVT